MAFGEQPQRAIQERERGQRGVDNMHYFIFSPRQAIHSNGNLVGMTLGCNPKYPTTKAGWLYCILQHPVLHCAG